MNAVEWLDVAGLDDIPPDEVIGVKVGAHDIALYRVEGQVFATDNFCSHGQARLCEGFLLGYEIECPFHQGRFDVRSGQATCAPATEAIRSFRVRIDAGRVCVALGGLRPA